MKDKCIQQLVRLISKIAQRYPAVEEPEYMTDIHIRVNQETGDVMAFDDDGTEITRIVVEEWIDNNDEQTAFYANVSSALKKAISLDEAASQLGIIKPYNYVLEDETGEHVDELYVVDNEDTIIIGGPFMEGLSKELDDFMKHLLED